ncbi:MAG: hypothetical protein PWP03_169 [Candidatus Woesearchaeota archaeon]|nr:hypothetical protein [Candidatus Woesearchaeota archaeon]MDN5327531.1 hypothetical protein [Candidatus Woesearchaeota archaeon]
MEIPISKILSLTKKIIKIRFLGDKKPLKLGITPTLNCNARCEFCNIWKYHHKNELSVDFYKQLFKTLKNDVFWLHITGGEPFLSKELYKILELATKELKFLILVNINTNGTIPLDNLFKIVKSNPKINFVLSFSLDGDFEFHKKRKGFNDKQIEILKKNLMLAKRFNSELRNFDYEIAYLLPTPHKEFIKKNFKNHAYACFSSNSEYYHNSDIKINNDLRKLIEHINNEIRNLPYSVMGFAKRISLIYTRKAYLKKQEIRYFPFYLIVDSHGKVYSDIYNYKLVGDFSRGIDFSKLKLPKKVKLSPLSCDNLFYFLH